MRFPLAAEILSSPLHRGKPANPFAQKEIFFSPNLAVSFIQFDRMEVEEKALASAGAFCFNSLETRLYR
jgi:hypothetical protein